jgi:hypothetical protein
MSPIDDPIPPKPTGKQAKPKFTINFVALWNFLKILFAKKK